MLHMHKILAASDFSPGADAALEWALDLAVRFRATLHLIYVEVLRDDPFAPASYPKEHTERVRARLREQLTTCAGRRGDVALETLPDVRCEVLQEDAAATGILRYAREEDVDLIVMGTHGRRGIKHLLLGSVAEEVVRLAPMPVLTVRETVPSRLIRSVLVPVDFSHHAGEALLYAKELAARFGARIDVLHVIEEAVYPAFYNAAVYSVYDIQPEIENEALRHLKGLCAKTLGVCKDVTVHVRVGHAASEIVHHAEEQETDLIVMATHGLTGLAHLLIGSVTENVVRRAPCPVFAVKSFGKSLIAANRKSLEQADAFS
ncbi:MAG: universal stress protein [Bacteroidetes bacterium]|nr:MAG: universal stress protein [Bacteroidota bacterium]